MSPRKNMKARQSEADGRNPLNGKYWAEGSEGRKAGSKVPPGKRKRKRRRGK
jgi:hypothetical protein